MIWCEMSIERVNIQKDLPLNLKMEEERKCTSAHKQWSSLECFGDYLHLDLSVMSRRLQEFVPFRPYCKRSDYLEWPDYFMAIAFLSAQRSKDPRTQVGACIVNEENKIVGIGYNGMPVGCHDDVMPWSREADDILETKQLYVCHAELNAVLNKNSTDVKNCKIYVALFPCNECAKVVIQSGIKEVIYYSDKYHDKPEFAASRRMLDLAGVKYRQYTPKKQKIEIDFSVIERVNNLEEVTHGHTLANLSIQDSKT